MKFKVVLSLALASLVFVSSAQADILCQRKKEKKPSNAGSVLNLKLVKGTNCPSGFVKLADFLTAAEITNLINQQLSTISTSSVGTKGDTGEKGDTGPQGVQGEQGIQGEAGPQGIQGETGPQGEVGPQGEAGPQGIQGETGPQGEVGPQGIQGETGPQGPKGDKGESGLLSIDSCYTKTESRTGTNDETETVYCNNPSNDFVFHVGFSVDKDSAGPVREVLEFTENSQTYSHPIGASVRAYNGILAGSYTLSVTLLCCPINVEKSEETAG